MQDLPPGRVVPHDDDHRQPEPHRGLEVEAVQAERAVALDDAHRPLRREELRRDRERRADAEGAERAGVEPAPGPGTLSTFAATATTLPPSRDERHVPGARGDRVDRLREPEVVDGPLVALLEDALPLAPRGLLLAQRTRPRRGRRRRAPAASASSTLRESPTMPTSMGRFRPISVASTSTWTTRAPPREGRLRPVAEPEVERRAHDEHHVRRASASLRESSKNDGCSRGRQPRPIPFR